MLGEFQKVFSLNSIQLYNIKHIQVLQGICYSSRSLSLLQFFLLNKNPLRVKLKEDVLARWASQASWDPMLVSRHLTCGFTEESRKVMIANPLGESCYPLVMTNIAMENHHFEWENPLFLW